jgi:hypothetical protein
MQKDHGLRLVLHKDVETLSEKQSKNYGMLRACHKWYNTCLATSEKY